MKRRKQGLLWLLIGLISFVIALSGLSYSDLKKPLSGEDEIAATESEAGATDSSGIIITGQTRRHILYGDRRGGGHFHTADKPCKTEFPAFWTEDRIIKAIRRIAANDNLPWRRESNGYKVVEQTSGTLILRVVKSGNRVITGYPTNTERNPCPGQPPANDNFNE